MRKLLVLLMLPAILFLWFIGWSLIWLGQERKMEEEMTELTLATIRQEMGEMKK